MEYSDEQGGAMAFFRWVADTHTSANTKKVAKRARQANRIASATAVRQHQAARNTNQLLDDLLRETRETNRLLRRMVGESENGMVTR